ncbi:MAG: hypothetical protein WA937_02365 [Flavobacteriales bacterium]
MRSQGTRLMEGQRPWRQVLPWITAFAVAMGFLEATVVVYLRAIYYPTGFTFPLVSMAPQLVVAELLREAATLVMLLAPAALLSRNRLERFAWFCWAFAVWDLFYYVFLKVLLGWPESLLTWDVLFLLPTVWVGPVLAPCLISMGLLILAVLILRGRERNANYQPTSLQWFLLITAGLIMLYTFMVDPIRYLGSLEPDRRVGTAAMSALEQYQPAAFPWPLFGFACVLGTGAFVLMLRDTRSMDAPETR